MQHKCPTCEGRKETQAFVCGVGIGGLRAMPCDTCKAKGFLTDEELTALNERKAKRDERKAARLVLGFSMREMADRLGVPFLKYNDYEHGRADASAVFNAAPASTFRD